MGLFCSHCWHQTSDRVVKKGFFSPRFKHIKQHRCCKCKRIEACTFVERSHLVYVTQECTKCDYEITFSLEQ